MPRKAAVPASMLSRARAPPGYLLGEQCTEQEIPREAPAVRAAHQQHRPRAVELRDVAVGDQGDAVGPGYLEPGGDPDAAPRRGQAPAGLPGQQTDHRGQLPPGDRTEGMGTVLVIRTPFYVHYTVFWCSIATGAALVKLGSGVAAGREAGG